MAEGVRNYMDEELAMFYVGSAVTAWLRCPAEKRPSPEALAARLVEIAQEVVAATESPWIEVERV